MIKNIFKSKTLYLTILFLINLSLIITLSVITFSSDIPLNTFISNDGNGDIFEPTSKTKYVVQERDFFEYSKFDAQIENTENLYSTYKVAVLDFKIGDKVNKDEIIGTYKGTSVKSNFDCILLSISESEDEKVVKFYNFNQYQISVTLEVYQYSSSDFKNEENLSFFTNGKSFSVKFLGFDFDLLESNRVILAKFKPLDVDSFVLTNAEMEIRIKIREYLKHYYLPAKVFDNMLTTKNFFAIINSEYEILDVTAISVIDDCALIESDYALYKGLALYL